MGKQTGLGAGDGFWDRRWVEEGNVFGEDDRLGREMGLGRNMVLGAEFTRRIADFCGYTKHK